MKVKVGQDSQTTKLTDALAKLELGAGCDVRLDVKALSVEKDGTIKFCEMKHSDIDVISANGVRKDGLRILEVRVRGMKVEKSGKIAFENVRIHSGPKTRGGSKDGQILFIDADVESRIVEIRGNHKHYNIGTYKSRKIQRPFQQKLAEIRMEGDGAVVETSVEPTRV